MALRTERRADRAADQERDPGRDGAQEELAQRAAQERPVGEPGHQPAADERGHRGQAERHRQVVDPEQVGQQRDQRADRERDQRGARRGVRRGQVVVVHAQFLADVHAQGLLGMRRDLRRDPVGQVRVHPLAAEAGRQLHLLRRGVVLQLVLFLADLRLDELVLGGDRDVLAGRHRERAGGQPGQAGQHDQVRGPAGGADPRAHARDQRDVGDQPVHGAEHGRAQPATGHVLVLVAVGLVLLVDLNRHDGVPGGMRVQGGVEPTCPRGIRALAAPRALRARWLPAAGSGPADSSSAARPGLRRPGRCRPQFSGWSRFGCPLSAVRRVMAGFAARTGSLITWRIL